MSHNTGLADGLRKIYYIFAYVLGKKATLQHNLKRRKRYKKGASAEVEKAWHDAILFSHVVPRFFDR